MQEGKVIAPFFESRVKARIKVITHLFLNLKGSNKTQMRYAPNIQQLNKDQHNSLAQGDFGQIKWIFFYNNRIYIYVLNKWTRV